MNFEQNFQKIPTKTEVLEILSRFVEGATEVRELSDEQGLYVFEVEKSGDREGEVIRYAYIRKGNFPDGNATAETHINVTYEDNGIPVGGKNLARYKPETGEWEDVV